MAEMGKYDPKDLNIWVHETQLKMNSNSNSARCVNRQQLLTRLQYNFNSRRGATQVALGGTGLCKNLPPLQELEGVSYLAYDSMYCVCVYVKMNRHKCLS